MKETADEMCHIYTYYDTEWLVDDHNFVETCPFISKVKVKQSRYGPGVAQRFPGS